MKAVPAGDKTEMVGRYVADKIGGIQYTPGMYVAFAFISDSGDFLGGCVISNYRENPYGNDCEISCASESPVAFRPQVMEAVFGYIFGQLGCVRCTSITTKKNKRARKFLEALGFVLEGCARLAYDGRRDALIYGFLASDCRYLAGGLNGEIITEAAAAA